METNDETNDIKKNNVEDILEYAADESSDKLTENNFESFINLDNTSESQLNDLKFETPQISTINNIMPESVTSEDVECINLYNPEYGVILNNNSIEINNKDDSQFLQKTEDFNTLLTVDSECCPNESLDSKLNPQEFVSLVTVDDDSYSKRCVDNQLAVETLSHEIDSSDGEFDDETLLERLKELSGIVPLSMRNYLCDCKNKIVRVAKRSYRLTKSTIWILSSSFVVGILPLMLEIERMTSEEQQNHLQRQAMSTNVMNAPGTLQPVKFK